MKLDPKEKEIADSVERREWRSVPGVKGERKRYGRYAAATFRKDQRVNIRISSKDLEAIRKRALEEGLPYQTLISNLLHRYVFGTSAGRLTRCRERRRVSSSGIRLAVRPPCCPTQPLQQAGRSLSANVRRRIGSAALGVTRGTPVVPSPCSLWSCFPVPYNGAFRSKHGKQCTLWRDIRGS